MIVCPTCSSPNPDGAQTCSTCGSPLGGASAVGTVNRYPMALAPGTKLNGGAFSIGRVLGQGGFGITYKGNDINLARLVAIKELFPDGSRRQEKTVVPPYNVSPGEWDITRREFIEEARTVARFSHPGIVNVYFVWEENGTAYQAMEFLDGQSAGALVEKGKLGENEAVTIIEKVADALATLHASGFIHRDLKPDNIVQTKDGRTVLIDFGTAKQFVREKTQKLNPVLTPGYAPLEQYSSQARFDHRLDIYALGATLYHLLTGEIPVSAVERAAGVDLPSVREKNPSVSATVSEAVERAMAVKVGDRFDSVGEFARALRNTKQTLPQPQPQPVRSQAPRGVTPTPSNVPPPQNSPQPAANSNNPYLSQIRALNEGLKAGLPPLSFPGQARLDAIERELKGLAVFASPSPMNCPSCHQNTVKSVSGNYAGACPFDGTQLTRIEWPIGKCAVCRAGTLQFHALGADEFMCGVCRRASVRRVQRPGFLGLVAVSEFECPVCRAQYAPISANAARLKQVDSQYGNTPFLGQTCTFGQWNDAANASGQVGDCPNCQARFIEQKNKTLLLAAWSSDTYSVAKNMGGQSASPERWAQLAAGATQDTSTHRCATCHAQWNIELSGPTLTLLRANATEQERARSWGFSLGQPYHVRRWVAKASGKASGEPGRWCSNCRTEFDSRPGLEMFALVSTPSALLDARSTQILSWNDWHRLSQKLPISSEERGLRDESAKLNAGRNDEAARQNAFLQNKRRDINSQLDGLYKRAALEGFGDMGVASRDAREGERLLWASRALKFKFRQREGAIYWDQDGIVRFLVSQSRLWIEGSKSNPLTEVSKVEIQYQSRLPILVIHLTIRQRPIGFGIDPSQIEVTIDGSTRSLLFDVHDVMAILKRLTG